MVVGEAASFNPGRGLILLLPVADCHDFHGLLAN